MKGIVALICLFAVSATAATDEKFKWDSNAKHLSGPELKADSFKGKVVFVEFWGINCGPCIRMMPHVDSLNKKYPGKIAVVASHVQGNGKQVTDYLESKNFSFAAYQQFRVGGSVQFSGIPYSAVFDSKGYLVAHGRPNAMMELVPDLIKAMSPPGSLLADLNIQHYQSYEKKLIKGKPLKTSLVSLKKYSSGSDEKATEAKMIVDHVNGYIDTEVAEIVALAAKEPGHAYSRLMSFGKQISGLPQFETLRPVSVELKGYKYLRMIVQCRTDYEKLDVKSQYYKGYKKRLVTKLNGLVARADVSDAVKAEAQGMLDSIG